MRELLLDAETLYTRAQAHDALAKAFGFPADYGRTLDALYDLLTACPPARLTLRHAEKLVDNMGNYGELLLARPGGRGGREPVVRAFGRIKAASGPAGPDAVFTVACRCISARRRRSLPQ